jgi:formimidoylglutamate deiminase
VTSLQAAWTWIDGRLEPACRVDIADDGRIAAVGPATGPPDRDRREVALLPGFVNAHSHAFQWGLRGVVQQGRDALFALADRLDLDGLHALSRRAFRAMRRAGYTAVGEFHYLHHQPDGTPYTPATATALAVIEAARLEGLRICLLHAAYLRPSGLVADWAAGQRRFRDPDPEAFLARHRQLADAVVGLGDSHVGLGVAPHSVRTVPADALAEIGRATAGPLHVHVNEQRREIEECRAEYGLRPFDVLDRAGLLGGRTTLIHMTHADDGELARTAAAGAAICFCPTTERDLGDGIGPSRAATASGIRQCVGSDSQARIDPFEELHLLEGHERLRSEARLVLEPPAGRSLAAHLIDVGTRGGADALQLGCGAIEAGRWADLVEIDLSDPDLAGVEPGHLPEAIAFSATPRAVRATWVGGSRSE